MKTSLLIVFGVLGAMAALAKAESAVTAFDGTWAVTLNGHEYKDPNTGQTAQAYVYHFNAQVKNGLLYGERGTKGSPGWLELKGKIEADGTAHLHANALTGPEKYNFQYQGAGPAHAPPGRPYDYDVAAKFKDGHGTGKRIGPRAVTIDFAKS